VVPKATENKVSDKISDASFGLNTVLLAGGGLEKVVKSVLVLIKNTFNNLIQSAIR